ncbi:NAD(P)-binding protein [Trichoderma austrokoningii]
MADPTNFPKGSWVLVTGVTGFVASHIAKAFLDRGFRVLGTVRNLDRASWLTKDVLEDFAARGDFELVQVTDLANDHAFDEAIKGVSAVIHVASIITLDPDPNKVIPQTVAGATSILEAAIREPSVKAFVYTSSIGAVTMAIPGNNIQVTWDTYNDFATEAAWKPPPYMPSRGMLTYMAKERKPHFTVNSVPPSAVIGEALHKVHNEGAGAWIRNLYDGDTSYWGPRGATYGVDVKDVAVLHVAAALDPAVDHARLQAWGHNCNGNDILAIMRKHYPEHQFVADLANQTALTFSADFGEPLALLRKWGNQDGWTPLEQTVVENVDSILRLNAD